MPSAHVRVLENQPETTGFDKIRYRVNRLHRHLDAIASNEKDYNKRNAMWGVATILRDCIVRVDNAHDCFRTNTGTMEEAEEALRAAALIASRTQLRFHIDLRQHAPRMRHQFRRDNYALV